MFATCKRKASALASILSLALCSNLPLVAQEATNASVASNSSTAVTVTVNILTDRHAISPYVYGVNFPSDTSYIANSGATFVRWGGNSSSRYNWQNFNTNSANDWYFQNRQMSSTALYNDSRTFISGFVDAGASPLMTIPMLGWVSKDSSSYSYSVATFGAQCGVNPYLADDGNGLKTDCATNITGVDPNVTSVPFLDSPKAGDPAGSVYLSEWMSALSPLWGSAHHFYDMDNEMDIWSTAPNGGTHHDIHPAATSYNEMRDTFLAQSRALKSIDSKAIRFGPVSCCWWFYFNGANNNDKAAHAGIDFMPWWLNEVFWSDLDANTRSLEVFDFHAYPDTPDTSSYTLAQKQALALRIGRDFWDPTYVSESATINQPWVTQLQPDRTIPFRLPRIRGIVNSIYPSLISVTEWNVAFAGESDFSTALADADILGILGRERVYAASRWTAADPSVPAFQALKMYRNFNGTHGTFGGTSIAAPNTGDPDLFSSYAGLLSSGEMTLVLINKDPANSVVASLSTPGFTDYSVKTYQLTQASPTTIVATPAAKWSPTVTLPPYSLTLLLIYGASTAPSAEWDLNPDTTMVAAGGSVQLHPYIVSGSGSVTMTAVSSDSGITITNTTPAISTAARGVLTVKEGTTSGIYHYSVTGIDNTEITQIKTGHILVGNPPATMTKTGDGQKATKGSTITLGVTFNSGSSGGSSSGASIRFSATGGTLSSRVAVTNSSGVATVTLTLPSTAGTVGILAEGPYALGHPEVAFTETAQ